MKKCTLDDLGNEHLKNDDRYLETLSCWLEHGSSVTWKSLLDVLGHFETKHVIDDLTDKIASEVGGPPQVSVYVYRVNVLCGVLSGRSSVALLLFVLVFVLPTPLSI